MIGHLAHDLALLLGAAAGLFIIAFSDCWWTSMVNWPSQRTEGQGGHSQGLLTTGVTLVDKAWVEQFQTNTKANLFLSLFLLTRLLPSAFHSPTSQLRITQPVWIFMAWWITRRLQGVLTFKGSRWEAISMLCETIRTHRLHSWSNIDLPLRSQSIQCLIAHSLPGSTQAVAFSAKLSSTHWANFVFCLILWFSLTHRLTWYMYINYRLEASRCKAWSVIPVKVVLKRKIS